MEERSSEMFMVLGLQRRPSLKQLWPVKYTIYTYIQVRNIRPLQLEAVSRSLENKLTDA